MNYFTQVYKDTDKFRGPAIHFIKHQRYTDHKVGSKAYDAFWTQQEENCLYGIHTKDGDYITGFHYFYLNYCPIYRMVTEKRPDKTGKVEFRPYRVTQFPEFYSYDAAYFKYIEECQEQGKHAVVLKARRKGYSYKNASMLCRNYYFREESKGYVFATDKKFLVGGGVLTKAWDFMSHLDQYTPFAKARMVKDTDMHKRASMIIKDKQGNKIESGFKSEIIGFSLKSNPDKLRGIVADLIFFEEGGSFGELEDAVNIARPSVEQDSYVSGLICVYGTASLDNESMQSISRMFLNPESYNMLGVSNIWDDFSTKEAVGFFHPYYENLDGVNKSTGERLYMDKDGNTLKKAAIDYCMSERKKTKDKASSQRVIDAYVIERPLRPAEALSVYKSSIFPREQLREQWIKTQMSNDIKAVKHVGHLKMTEGKPDFVEHEADDSIQGYHLKPGESKKGAIVIWEFPPGSPAPGSYIIGVDSYDFDAASYSDSLGSCLVFKRKSTFEKHSDCIVAEFTGRPDMAEDFYETVRRLAMYYNAQIMYENNNKGIYTYFVNRYCDWMLSDAPDVVDRLLEKARDFARPKGINVTKPIRNIMNGWIREFLLEEFEDGHTNIERIYSAPLLEELLNWNEKGNFDRVAAMGCVVILRQQLWNRVQSDPTATRSYRILEHPLFSKEYYDQVREVPKDFKF